MRWQAPACGAMRGGGGSSAATCFPARYEPGGSAVQAQAAVAAQDSGTKRTALCEEDASGAGVYLPPAGMEYTPDAKRRSVTIPSIRPPEL